MSPSRRDSKSFGRRRRKMTTASYAALAEGVLLQPWFLPQRTTLAIHRLVPVDFWKKMRNVFDDYGCIVCGTESNYHSNGMCRSCYRRTREKDEDSDWLLSYSVKKSLPESYSLILPSRVRARERPDALKSYTIIRSTKPWL